jgi:SPP1 gp7 family putative phage head morphogenesis protein
MSGEQMRWMIDTFLALVAGGAVIPTEVDEARIREILEMPPREEDDKPLINPEAQAQRDHADATAQDAHDRGQEAADAEVARNFQNDKRRATDPVLSKVDKAKASYVKGKPAEGATLKAEGDRKFTITKQQAQVALASARERVDFAVIDKKQTAMSDDLAQQLAQVVARATFKEIGSDEDLKRLTDEDTADIGQLQFPAVAVGRLKVTMQKALAESWALGRQTAQSEVRKTAKKFARGLFEFADLRDKAAQYFESTSFKVAGDVSDRARSIMQQELLSSVKNGRSPQQTRTAIWDRLLAKGLTSAEAVRSIDPAAELGAVDEADAAHYLDTVARTNLFTAMNEARYAEFSDPQLGDFVVALRYSAVLDSHTTDICFGLHDSVWRTDSEKWDEYRPPNHYNCRSVLIPITAIDVEDGLWDGVESDDPPVEPQEGFGK